MNKRKIIGILAAIAITSTIAMMPNNKISTNLQRNHIVLAQKETDVHAVVINGNENLVLRKTARSNGKVTSYLSVGEMLSIKSETNNYYLVTVQETGATGYISKANLQVIKSGINDDIETLNESGIIVNVSSKVNLREESTMNSSILSKISDAVNVNVLGKQGEWFKVDINGQVGFIYEEYVGVYKNNANTDNIGKEINNTKVTLPVQSKEVNNNNIKHLNQPIVMKPIKKEVSHTKDENITNQKNGNNNKVLNNTKVDKSTSVNQSNIKTKTTKISNVDSKNSNNSVQLNDNKKKENNQINGRNNKPVEHKTTQATNNQDSSSKHQTISNNTNSKHKIVNENNNKDVTKNINNSKKNGTDSNTVSNSTNKNSSQNSNSINNNVNSKTNKVDNKTLNNTNGSDVNKKDNNINKINNVASNKGINNTISSNSTKANENNGTSSSSNTSSRNTQSQFNGVVNTNNAPVLAGNGQWANEIGNLSNGTKVEIINESNGYYAIKYKNGIGYINKNNVNTTDKNIPNYTNINNKNNSTYNNSPYKMPLKQYVSDELNEYMNSNGITSMSKTQMDSVKLKLTNAINPSSAEKAANTMFEFLDIAQYRGVNEQLLNEVLDSHNGVMQGQGQAFINAAKEYNIDPIYFVVQSGLESDWGSSKFAKGVTITEVANFKSPKYNKEGQLIGYNMTKLENPVTVYNLYGIDAQDATQAFPNKTMICATSYAYEQGWTSVPKAIAGAAKFLSTHYMHNTDVAQQTPYALRYINGTSGQMWHQYSSDIEYGMQLGKLINQYSYLYNSNDRFTFKVPEFPVVNHN